MSRATRVLLTGWSGLLVCGFVLAYQLEPDPRGFGTHQQLGLPGCTFRVVFGVPCPSCGMTTSFTHFMRGDIIESARANVAGLLLAIVCLVQIPWCWLSVYYGCYWRVSNPETVLVWLLLVIGGVSALQWIFRLCFV